MKTRREKEIRKELGRLQTELRNIKNQRNIERYKTLVGKYFEDSYEGNCTTFFSVFNVDEFGFPIGEWFKVYNNINDYGAGVHFSNPNNSVSLIPLTADMKYAKETTVDEYLHERGLWTSKI